MELTTILIPIAIIAVATMAIAFFYKRLSADKKIQSAEEKAALLIENANKTVQDIISKSHRESDEILKQSRKGFEQEIQKRRESADSVEKHLINRETYLSEREKQIEEKERQLQGELEKTSQLNIKKEDHLKSLLTTLEKIAGMKKAEAEKLLLSTVEEQTRTKAGTIIKQVEEKAHRIANRKAKEIISTAMQKVGMDYVSSSTTSIVQLPDDELKGRIIGREGRNIRTFEAISGVDVIIDDTPKAVVLSSFDPIRREIAKMAMGKLIVDGRIHPARVEEAIDKSKAELDDVIKEFGERAVDSLGLKFHPELIKLIGRLNYRTSYGQNMLSHALESAKIAASMAQSLGVNVTLATKGGLLHDIGKALDFETDGTHTTIGEDICRKYGESEEVINCIMAHHEEDDPDTIEAIIVCMADAISSSRPGARRESVDAYIKRLEKLEAVANTFEGVEKAYAIQAGREVRVMVRPEEVDDDGAHKIAFDLAKKIETELDYPGEVKVSVIRETRAIGTAH